MKLEKSEDILLESDLVAQVEISEVRLKKVANILVQNYLLKTFSLKHITMKHKPRCLTKISPCCLLVQELC